LQYLQFSHLLISAAAEVDLAAVAVFTLFAFAMKFSLYLNMQTKGGPKAAFDC
jgi:hypothetical protein